CDIFSLAMSTPKRLEYMNFTKPYLSFPLVIATKLDTLFIPNVEDVINTKKLAIIKGYSYAEILKERYPLNKIVEVNNIQEGLSKVANSEVFGFIDTLATVGYELQREHIGELKIAGKFNDNWELSIGVRNDDLVLLDIFEKAIESLSFQEKQEIFNQWLFVKIDEKTNYGLATQIALVLLILMAFIVYRNRHLQQYNKKIKKQATELAKINKELIKTKKKLEKSLSAIEVLYDCMLDAVFVFEEKTCIDVNEVAVKMFGYETKDEMKGLSITAFTHIQSLVEVQTKFKDNTTPYEIKCVRKNGTVFPTLAQGTNIVLNGKKVRVSVLIDLSEIKSKEKLLIQQSKLASMGEMIGNIAHQWRQPLNIISTTATGMKLQLEFGTFNQTDAVKELDVLNDTVQYLSKTIDDFRNFFKSEKEQKVFSIEQSIRKNIKLLEGAFKMHNIEIVFDKVEDFNVKSYENEFIQAILNIFYNAKDVLENKNYKRYIFIAIYKEDKEAVITIKDNGGGIKEEIIAQIFDPYFTTKYKSNGTGIGLYMTHQIIQGNMEGKIEVTNETFFYENIEYTGAVFKIKLPLL
ncbi:MAG: transporter substrate-binding domain-containing protein, partial [Arcobacteraceae bacterium]